MNDTLTSPAGPRRLVRTSDGKIAGVASGIGHYLGIDPTIVRIAFLLLVFAGGIGLLLYAACWLVMPKGEVVSTPAQTGVDPWTALGVVGLVAGGCLLVGWWGIGDFGRVAIAVALVVGGVLLLGRTTKGGDEPGGPSTPAVPLAPPPGPDGGDAPSAEPDGDEPPDEADAVGDEATRVEAASAASPRRSRVPVASLVTAALLVGFGVALAGALAGWFDAEWNVLLAAGLVVLGVGLAVAAVTGGAPWLVPLGIVLVLALLTAAVVEPLEDRGVGTEDIVPATLASLEPEYRHGVGELVVDLSRIALGGQTREVEVRLGIGKAEVIVPTGATLDLRGHVGAGRLEAPDGSDVDGLGRDLDLVDPGAPDGGTIVLQLEVGMGEGEVRRG